MTAAVSVIGFTGVNTGMAASASGGVNHGSAPRFGLSAIVDEGRHTAPTGTPAASFSGPPAAPLAGGLTVGGSVDVIAGQDTIQQKVINGTTVFTCNPGIGTAQNETTIAVNPGSALNLVAGENDYRLYEPSENRYDSSGGYDVSADGGKTWKAGFLPGLVRANTAAPGPYESAGDPSLSAGPAGTFWFGNIDFDRSDHANAISASVSNDGGNTWTTHFVLQTTASGGANLFNDKAYIAADPANAMHAVITWTQFHGPNPNFTSSDIVFSQTTDGGSTWSKPVAISSKYPFSQGSVPVIAGQKIYVAYEATNTTQTADEIAFTQSSNGGSTWSTKLLAVDSDISLPSWTPRVDSFPTLAVAGSDLHIVWSNWNGTNAELAYLRSTNGGVSWSAPVTLAAGSADNFFPWVAARGAKVYVSFFDRANGAGDVYRINGVGSSNGGASWTVPVHVSSSTYNAGTGNQFSYPSCAYNFIGDYSGAAVDSAGVDHVLWTGVTTGTGANQDPFTATVKI